MKMISCIEILRRCGSLCIVQMCVSALEVGQMGRKSCHGGSCLRFKGSDRAGGGGVAPGLSPVEKGTGPVRGPWGGCRVAAHYGVTPELSEPHATTLDYVVAAAAHLEVKGSSECSPEEK